MKKDKDDLQKILKGAYKHRTKEDEIQDDRLRKIKMIEERVKQLEKLE